MEAENISSSSNNNSNKNINNKKNNNKIIMEIFRWQSGVLFRK